jgi:NO-binding membrane sensor protein with MHYT domain
MQAVHNFSYGLLTPGLAYLMSCLGCFLGLRLTARGRAAVRGAARARWLLAGALSIGITGIWVMHFIGMLGFTVPGQSIHYSIPVTILSMLIAAFVVSIGLLIVGFSPEGPLPLLLGGLIFGCGVASMHYMGMAALAVSGMSMHYNVGLVALSVLIAVVAGTVALWAATHLRGVWSALLASLIMGVAVSGMHYTGMAAMRMEMAGTPFGGAGGASPAQFILPLVLGISAVTFVLAAIISVAPTEAEILEDAALDRLAKRTLSADAE